MARKCFFFALTVIAMTRASFSLVPESSLYTTLGLNISATDDDIRKAFRKLSRSFHPDRSTGDHDSFVEIQKAYDILSDPELRIVYDQLGLDVVLEAQKRGVEHVMKKTENQHYQVEVSLEDIYSGTEVSINHRRHTFCPTCRGSGAKPHSPFTQCSQCQGTGQVLRVQQMGHFYMQTQEVCGHCGGTGRVPKHHCKRCKGAKVIEESVTLNVEVEKGVPDGHQILIPRAASCVPKTIPGDVVVSIRSKPHKHFKRDDASTLSRGVTIPLRNALLGFKSSIPHLDFHKVQLNRKGQITPFGFTEVIQGEGLPKFGGKGDNGDLIIHYKVKFPSELSEEHRQELIRVFHTTDGSRNGIKDEL